MQSNTPKPKESVSRRSFLGAAAAAISAGAVMSAPLAAAQSKSEISTGEQNHSSSNPGPINRSIAAQNSSSEAPPITDRGDVGPFWYSFDLSIGVFRTADGLARSLRKICQSQEIWLASTCALPPEATASFTGILPMSGPS